MLMIHSELTSLVQVELIEACYPYQLHRFSPRLRETVAKISGIGTAARSPKVLIMLFFPLDIMEKSRNKGMRMHGKQKIIRFYVFFVREVYPYQRKQATR